MYGFTLKDFMILSGIMSIVLMFVGVYTTTFAAPEYVPVTDDGETSTFRFADAHQAKWYKYGTIAAIGGIIYLIADLTAAFYLFK